MFKIYVVQFGGYVLEGETSNRQSARETVRTIRAGGRYCMIKFNGKKLNWKT